MSTSKADFNLGHLLKEIIAIYAPMIYMALCIRFLMRAEQIHYEGKWEGVGPWKSRLFWSCEMASSH
jgi:hypothetical protein